MKFISYPRHHVAPKPRVSRLISHFLFRLIDIRYFSKFYFISYRKNFIKGWKISMILYLVFFIRLRRKYGKNRRRKILTTNSITAYFYLACKKIKEKEEEEEWCLSNFFFFFRRKKKKREELRKGETKRMISFNIFFFLNTKGCLQSRKWLHWYFYYGIY